MESTKQEETIDELKAALAELESDEGLEMFVEGHGLQSRYFALIRNAPPRWRLSQLTPPKWRLPIRRSRAVGRGVPPSLLIAPSGGGGCPRRMGCLRRQRLRHLRRHLHTLPQACGEMGTVPSCPQCPEGPVPNAPSSKSPLNFHFEGTVPMLATAEDRRGDAAPHGGGQRVLWHGLVAGRHDAGGRRADERIGQRQVRRVHRRRRQGQVADDGGWLGLRDRDRTAHQGERATVCVGGQTIANGTLAISNGILYAAQGSTVILVR